MSVKPGHGAYLFRCDEGLPSCHAWECVGSDKLPEAEGKARDRGWCIEGDPVRHVCPRCVLIESATQRAGLMEDMGWILDYVRTWNPYQVRSDQVDGLKARLTSALHGWSNVYRDHPRYEP